MIQNRLSYHTPDKDSREEFSEIYVWGSNHHGQLGLEEKFMGKSHAIPRTISFTFVVREIACGEDHIAIVTSRGQIYTLGSNAEGRLGIGNRAIDHCLTPALVESCAHEKCIQIACGWGHTLAVMETGEVFSWGAGESGALGTGGQDSMWSPVRISLEDKVFLAAKKVSAGSLHSAFISELGTLYVCGSGDAGQLGTGRRERELRPVQMSLMTERVKDVACGVFHTLILTERSKVYATGGNVLGQLGLGSKKNTNMPTRIKELDYQRVIKVACGHHSAALTEKGEIYVWGTGVFGEFTVPVRFSQTGQVFKDISLNGFFGVAIDQDNYGWSWGGNNNGELGLGHFEPIAKLQKIDTLQNRKVEKFCCGMSFVMAASRTDETKHSISPLRHRKRSNVPSDFHTTPQKAENQGTAQDPSRFAPGSEKSRNTASKPLLRPSSVQKIRENQEYSHSRKASIEKSRKDPESPEFIDLLAGEKRNAERNTRREERGTKQDNIVVIEKLLKQKEALEKTIVMEREEKALLEENLLELNNRLQQIENGPDGLRGLSENFNRQAKKYLELKNYYEDESKQRSRILNELTEEQLRNKELVRTLGEKEEVIINLQVRMDQQGEMSKKRVTELEASKQRLSQHIETLEVENKASLVEINRLKETVAELHRELNHKLDSMQNLEDLRRHDLEDKARLEEDVAELKDKVMELDQLKERTLNSLDRETESRHQLEDELRLSRQREETSHVQIGRLKAEMEGMRAEFERKLEDERENNNRLMREKNNLVEDLQNLKEDLAQVCDEKTDLEEELEESQQKNSKLLDLLNQEIERQNEALNQKVNRTARKSILSSAEPLNESRDRIPRAIHEGNSHVYQSQFVQNKIPNPINRENLKRSVIETRSRHSEKIETNNTSSPTKEDRNVSRAIDFTTSQYILQEPSVDDKRLKSRERSDVDNSIIKVQPFDDNLVETTRKEDQTKRLVVAGAQQSSNVNETSQEAVKGILRSPTKDELTTIEDKGSHSGQKRRRSHSPLKNVLHGIEDKLRESSFIGESKDYSDELKEAHDRMVVLEKNKRDLHLKMQEFERRMKIDGEN